MTYMSGIIIKDMAKDKDYINLINSSRWKKLRHKILSKHPLCERCEEQDIFTPASEVHHVQPVETAIFYSDKESLMFNPNNLRALCHTCHVKTHEEIGRSGKLATKRINAKQVESINKKFFS